MAREPSAGLAQMVEHLICNQGVTSSNLVAGTIPTRSAFSNRRADEQH